MDQHTDCASTVTSLFVPPIFKKSVSADRIKTPVKPVGTFDETPYYSSSKLLRKYIEHYEKEQTIDLAKSLTVNQQNYAVVSEHSKSKDQVFIDREITLARSLLPNKSKQDNFFGSMTTDELLASTPYIEGLEGENLQKVTQDNNRGTIEHASRVQGNIQFYEQPFSIDDKENTRSMHFSDLSRTNLSSMQRNLQYSSDYCLNGVSYTPHKVKYRNILAETDLTNYRSAGNISSKDSRNIEFETQRTNTDLGLKHHNDLSRLRHTDRNGYFSPPESAKLSENAGRTPFNPRLTGKTSASPSSDTTEQILKGERPWECRKSLFKGSKKTSDSLSHYSIPLHFDNKDSKIRGFMEDCLAAGDAADVSQGNMTFTECQGGPVETLKNMLFTLQSMSEHTGPGCAMAEEDSTDAGILKQDSNDGQTSFNKAMSHLANLKEILGSTATSENGC